MNSLLAMATCICEMSALKLIGKREVERFSYLFLVLYRNERVKKYCRYLKDLEANATGIPDIRPYNAWVDYCRNKLGQKVDIYAAQAVNETTDPKVEANRARDVNRQPEGQPDSDSEGTTTTLDE